MKLDVLKDMPPKKEVVVYAGMSKLQRGYFANIEKGVLREELMKAGIPEANMISQVREGVVGTDGMETPTNITPA